MSHTPSIWQVGLSRWEANTCYLTRTNGLPWQETALDSRRTYQHNPPLHEVVDRCHWSGISAGAIDVRDLEGSAFAPYEDIALPACQQAIAEIIA